MGERVPAELGVPVPLPLESQAGCFEIVGGLGYHRRERVGRDVGSLVRSDRFARAVAVLVATDDGPPVVPGDGLEMNDVAVRVEFQEVDEPVLAAPEAHQGTLVRPVDARVSLGENHPVVVGTVDVVRAQDRLPPVANAAGRREDVVRSVPFVQLRSFDRRVVVVAVEHLAALAGEVGPVRRHRRDVEDAVDPSATLRERVDEIRVPVVVPERCRIDPSLGFVDEDRVRPPTPGIVGLGHVDAAVGVAVEDVERPLVAVDRECPDAVAVLWAVEGGW